MTKENSFLPTDYEAPKSGGRYMKFEQGDNIFRVLDSPIIGWEQWNEEKKPVRSRYSDGIPASIIDGKSPKHFWAMPVWNYRTKQVEILEITQKGIQDFIIMQTNDDDWGSPINYDINVKRTGEGLETSYHCMAKMPKQLDESISAEWLATKIDLDKLFSGDDPFSV